jgi:uncharacterized protein YndB with AHSA1/START domain
MADPATSPDSTVYNERVIAATQLQIFAAFEDPATLARWWGPKDFTNTFQSFDFREGGRWVYVMHRSNGADYANESVFREIVPHSRIVIEHVVKPWYRLTITLTEQGTQTHLRWVQEFEAGEVSEKMLAFCFTANEQNLDRLEAVLKDVNR